MEKIRYFFRYQWMIPLLAGAIMATHSIVVGPLHLALWSIPFFIWLAYAIYWGLKDDNDRTTGRW